MLDLPTWRNRDLVCRTTISLFMSVFQSVWYVSSSCSSVFSVLSRLVMSGANKHCCFGDCNSDSRLGRPGFSTEITFFSFPKPCLDFRHSSISKYRNHGRIQRVVSDPRAYIKNHVSSCEVCRNCEKWVIKCKRDDGKFASIADITKDTYICSKHFPGNLQTLDEFEQFPGEPAKKKRRPLDRNVPNTVENITHDLEYLGLMEIGGFRQHGVGEEADMNELSCHQGAGFSQDSDGEEADMTELSCHQEADFNQNLLSPMTEALVDLGRSGTTGKADATTQTEPEENVDPAATPPMIEGAEESRTSMRKKIVDLQSKVDELQKQINLLKRESRMHDAEAIEDFEMNLARDDQMSKFYLGFTYSKLLLIMRVLDVNQIKYWNSKKTTSTRLTHVQEFIVTLLRLRGGLLVQDIAYRFNISIGLVSSTTTTWIQLLFTKFETLRPSMFASREKVKEHLPKRFRNLPNIRVIVDCAEFFCETPIDFGLQSNVYSQYKAHPTFKALVGCTPNGCISFVSDLYEGSISDRALFMNCGIVEMLTDGDMVLADRGFDVKDVLDEKNIQLNIPAFLKGRDKFTPQEVIEIRNIAKNRIFVEHIVRRLKEFRFLDRTIPLNMRGVVSQILFVCACLSNFNEPLISE